MTPPKSFGLGVSTTLEIYKMASKLLPLRDVTLITSLSKSSIYRLIRAGKFPKPKQITVGRVAWFEAAVVDWINSEATI